MNEYLELDGNSWVLDRAPWKPEAPFYAVMGDPIEHSLSPVMQNAALSQRKIDTEYLAIRVQTSQLATLKNGEAGRLLAGFNATAPLKEAVSALCDGRTDQARTLGAVNTVKVEDGKWLGHNTDSGGVLAVASQAWGEGDPPARAVVLGAGGSARAAVDALARWGVAEILVQNRSAAGQKRFQQWVSGQPFADRIEVQGLTRDPEPEEDPAVWISCLAGGVSARPYLPLTSASGADLLLDLRYGNQLPAEDPPLGFRFSDGKPILLMQGGLSFGWWFGPPVPWPAMKEALD